jgi:hypothetical protein
MAKSDEKDDQAQAPAAPPPAATPQAPIPVETAPVVPAPAPVVYPTHLDETVPGGRYILDGRVVDAHGTPVRDR